MSQATTRMPKAQAFYVRALSSILGFIGFLDSPTIERIERLEAKRWWRFVIRVSFQVFVGAIVAGAAVLLSFVEDSQMRPLFFSRELLPLAYLLGVGTLLFALRSRRRLIYSGGELAIAAILCHPRSLGGEPFIAATKGFAALYLFVRGLDNAKEGVKQLSNEL